LDGLLATINGHLADEQRRTADEKRRADTEIERRRKSENAFKAEIQSFAELRDTLASLIESGRGGEKE
jgi:hypothetical protein